jgi:hypothetical protein
MKLLIATLAALMLCACSPAEQPTPGEQMLATQANTLELNSAFPLLEFPWRPDDGQVNDSERQFATVISRLHVPGYRSADTATFEPPPCAYYENSGGSLLVRTYSGEVWGVETIEGYFGGGRHIANHLQVATTIILSQGPEDPTKVAINTAELNRFANIKDVICPEDGQVYADAWMHYRFPWLYRQT